MNRNSALRNNIRKQNNSQGAIKRVRFSTSQQWRLNRPNNPPNVTKGAPNRTIINRNLKMIKAEQTPLKRAQRAYYGFQSRSPLLATDGSNAGAAGRAAAGALTTVRAPASDAKLPVHARLGTKTTIQAFKNSVAIAQLKKKRLEFQKRQEIIKQKIRLIENAKRNSLNRRNNVQRLNYGGLRSDQMVRANQVPRKNVQQRQMRVNRQTLGVRQNGNLPVGSSSASDLTVSVANDAAIMNGLAGPTLNNMSTDLNPRLQQEIALIQQMSRSQRTNTIDVGALHPAIPGLTVNPSQAIHGLNVMPLSPPVTTVIQPTVVVQQSARPKLTLNERFRSLKS